MATTDSRSMNEREEDSRIGTVLDERYRVLQPIAQGGMGAVYLGEQIKLGRTVAIKFLLNFYLFDESSRTRFAREAQAMSRLSHPHCVSVIDFGIDDLPYIVMDYVTGMSLEAIIHQEQMTFARAIRIALQILAGLAHAHGQGIIHRDIKPDNIIIQDAAGTGDHVKIVDFSIAKMADQSAVSLNGAIVGTPYYMSPEQALGGDVDARTDLYSVGIVIFEMLTGQKPFPGQNIAETLMMQRGAPVPSLGEVVPHVSFSEEIEAVIEKALSKSRDERFLDAFEFMRALAGVPEAEDLGDVSSDIYRIVRFDDSSKTVEVSPAQMPGREAAPKRAAGSTAKVSGRGFPKAVFFAGAVALAALLGAYFVASPGVEQKKSAALPARSIETAPGGEKEKITSAKELIAAGEVDEAILVLQDVRIVHPRAAEPAYLLGNLFSQKSWWVDAIKRYENAIDLEPGYAQDPVLNRNLIRALNTNKASLSARKLILDRIGDSAVPHLRSALEDEPSIRVRRRAAKVLRELTRDESSASQSERW